MYQNPYQNILPQQQVIQANGKASIDAIRMMPNSSVLIMDSTAPIVWLCVSDGIGNVTATPYDISVHQEPQPMSMDTLDQRLSAIERAIAEMGARYESDVISVEQTELGAGFSGNQKRRKSTGNASAGIEE